MKIVFATLLCSIILSAKAQTFKNPLGIFDPSPYGFSHTATAPASSQYVFIAGQSGSEDRSGTLSNDFRRQVQFTLTNLKIALTSYGLTTENVIKFTILIVDHDAEKLKIYTEEVQKIWKNGNYPVSTLIPVPRLALDDMKIEIDAIAVLSKK